jgi:NCS1 family nucleobase:cation symporter-1
MKIETRTIDYIPAEERHGKPRDLFPLWFASNMHLTAIVSGGLCIALGLDLFWSIVCIVLGNVLGGIFMASHSAQGPKLGIPQMIQSRAQFGVIGAIVPLFLVFFMSLGFFASSGLLGAQTLSSALSINLTWSIIITNVVIFVVTLYGHDLIHKIQKYLSWVFLVIFLIATVIVFRLPLPDGSWSVGTFNFSTFMLCMSIVATWLLSYAPYVADFSRYLPISTSPAKTFWYSYSGAVIGAVWMMLLGVILTKSIPGYLAKSGANFAELFGSYAIVMYIIIVLGQLSINVFTLYGSFMSTITTVEPFTKLKVTPKVRTWLLLVITIIATVMEIVGQGNFLKLFVDFILFISYFLIPWTSINLVDYYLLRRGNYSIKDIFDLNGKYGKVNWITAVAYIVALLVEIPFSNTTFYVGPISHAMGGADIAWIFGIIVPAVLYYFPSKRKIERETKLMAQNSQKVGLAE